MSEEFSIDFDQFEVAVSFFVKPYDFLNGSKGGTSPIDLSMEELRIKAQRAVLSHMYRIDRSSPLQQPLTQDGRLDMNNKTISLEKLFVFLGSFFQSDDGYVRKHAMILLGTVIHDDSTLPISTSMVEKLINFCCEHLVDWYFVEGAALVYLGLLKNHLSTVALGNIESSEHRLKGKVSIEDYDDQNNTAQESVVRKTSCARAILDSILQDVHAPSFSQPVRQNILKSLDILLHAFPECIRAVGRKVVTRIFCQMENEKDPRNLMINFPLTEYLLKTYSDLLIESSEHQRVENLLNKTEDLSEETTQRLDMIADVLLSYYPIRFKPLYTDIYNVTETDLQVRLSRCFLASSALVTRLLDGCLDLLNDSLAVQKTDDTRDALDMISTCIQHFDIPYLAQQYSKYFFDVIKSNAWYGHCPELPALSACFSRLLCIAFERNEASDVINSTLKLCVQLLLFSHSENPGPFELVSARQLLLDVAKAKENLLICVCSFMFSPPNDNTWKDHIYLIFQLIQKLPLVHSQMKLTVPWTEKTDPVSLQLYHQWIGDLEFYRELTCILLSYVYKTPEKQGDLGIMILNLHGNLLKMVKGDIKIFLDSSTPQSQEAAVQLVEIFMNLTIYLSILAKNEKPCSTVVSQIENMIYHMGYLLGLTVDYEVETWAIQWRNIVDSKASREQNQLILEILKNGLIQCSQHCPHISLSCLQKQLTSLLEYADMTSEKNHFLLTLSLQLMGVWGAHRQLFLEIPFQPLAVLLNTLFIFLPKAFNTGCQESYSLNWSHFELLETTLKSLFSALNDTQPFDETQDVLFSLLTELLSANSSRYHILNNFISRLFTVFQRTELTPEIYQTLHYIVYVLQNTFITVFMNHRSRKDLMESSVEFISHTYLSHSILNENNGFNAFVLLLPGLVAALLSTFQTDTNSLQQSQESPQQLQQQHLLEQPLQQKIMTMLNLVLQHACEAACNITKQQSDCSGILPALVQHFVISSYRDTLIMFVLYGPSYFVERTKQIVTSSQWAHQSYSSLLHTSVTLGHISYASVKRVWENDTEKDSTNITCKSFLAQIVCQCCEISYGYRYCFFPSLVLQTSLLMELTALPVLSHDQEVHEIRRWECEKPWLMRKTVPESLFSFSTLLKQCFFSRNPYLVTSTGLHDGSFYSILLYWQHTHDIHERLALSSIVFLFLATLPLNEFLTHYSDTDTESSLISILLWTLQSLPWIERNNTMRCSSNPLPYLEFQAEIDRLSGYVTFFTLSLLYSEHKTRLSSTAHFLSRESPETPTNVQCAIQNWLKQLLINIETVLKGSVCQAVQNSIPRVRLAAIQCLHIVARTKHRFPDLHKYKTMILNSLEPTRNDSRYVVRRLAALCVNCWSSL